MDIICSLELKQQLAAVFEVNSLLPTQRSIGSTLTNTLYRLFVHKLADIFAQQQQTECVTLNISEMPVEGLAKIDMLEDGPSEKNLTDVGGMSKTTCSQVRHQPCRMCCTAV